MEQNELTLQMSGHAAFIKRREEGTVQKRVEEILATIQEEEVFTVAVLDESIFVHDDVLVRRKIWVPKGIRPVVTITGSHQKTYTCLVLLPLTVSSSLGSIMRLMKMHFWII